MGSRRRTEQAQAITQEVLSLNLFWIFAAIEAHIPQKYQSALSELILDTMEAGWGTTVPVGSAAWTAYLNEWQERRRRYSRLVEEGMSPLAVSAEAAALMEENQLVNRSGAAQSLDPTDRFRTSRHLRAVTGRCRIIS